ncbi:uncharacterized protein KY384_006349 [Bacidia gigantensis]|uniref:uncharacterized protein n=1 Tax=Bacidia gigantensis TaxID=2732470 RepID=UPI001D03A8B3|nr:uncharacterized protein KY384_006349 [Bacidia gigantensis]KAG8528662.1 hypothetical protein KY384_006349 [Bacidia gigantensis]
MAEPCRIVVMASGNGSNFQALIDAVISQRISNAQIVRLFVNRKKAYAVTRAESVGIPSTYFNMISQGFQGKGEVDPKKLKEARSRYDAVLAEVVLQDRPSLVVLAGWMHKNDLTVPNDDAGMYDGADAIERAFRDFQEGKLKDNRTGLMIHYVIEEVDRGEPILVEEIECSKDEDLHQLEQKFHVREHELIVNATAKVVGELMAN